VRRHLGRLKPALDRLYEQYDRPGALADPIEIVRRYRDSADREVAGLLARGYGPGDPGLRGIGYREFFLMQRGCWTLSNLREAIQRDSRRFAKRQITFFKSLPGVEWLRAGEPEGIVRRIDGFLAAS